MLKEKIENLKNNFLEEIEKIQPDEARLFELEKKYLGRKSEFTSILKSLKNLTIEEKKEIGNLANKTKKEISDLLSKKKKEITEAGANSSEEQIDVTIPGKRAGIGHLNPISIVQMEIEDIFISMGFEITDGPEVETEHYNFDALNIPADHPARDMQDTFFLKNEKMAMRSQTSAVQARYMQNHQPPFKIIVPGKCFRNEATDSTHEHTFYQFDLRQVKHKT